MKKLFVAAGLALSFGSVPAQAQWIVNGDEVGFFVDYSWSATLNCSANPLLLSGSCSVADNAVTISSGDAYARFSFAGAVGSQYVSNLGGSLAFGAFSMETGGTGPFLFPTQVAQVPLFFADLIVQLSGPISATRTLRVGFIRESGTEIDMGCCENFTTWTTFGVPPGGPGSYFGIIQRTTSGDGKLQVDGVRSFDVVGTISIVPEPSTYAMMAAGLGGLGLLLRRRQEIATR